MWIALVSVLTLMPIASYTGRILLQTAPPHLGTQLDTSLREIAAHTDGLLEFRNEHFWTLSFRKMVSSHYTSHFYCYYIAND